jgi:uncharacterized protein YgiM (DUF1202 family)
MMKIRLLILSLLCAYLHCGAQTNKYVVVSNLLNVRSGPGTQYNVEYQLPLETEVEVLDKNKSGWWLIEFSGLKGYVSAHYLKVDEYATWEKKTYNSGSTPDCENVIPEYDHNLDNHLKVEVGSHTDVVIKMMHKTSFGDRCIRVVYVNTGDTYYLRNVPEGLYYLKIAYGKDYRQGIVDGKCYIKFVDGAIYEKGKDILDFNVIKTSRGTSVPYFELFLDVVTTTDAHQFKTGNISEAEFNN